MKFSMVAIVAAALCAGAAFAQDEPTSKGAAPAPAPASSELKTLRQQASYSLGVTLGKNLKTQSVDVDPGLLARGLKDALSDAKLLMTEAQCEQAIEAFQKELVAKQAAAGKAAGAKNKKAGEEFLAANAKKEGVKTLKSGLQYKVIKEGNGKSPKATDTVKTNYEGKLIDGTVFDSSYKRGKPASFPVNRVIAGWTEALQLMKVGSKWQLFIPSELAYKDEGSPPVIGPNEVLIFDIELLGIEG